MMITRIGDKIISVTKVPDLRNYRGDRVLGLSCTSGRFGYIKLLSDLELPEFWDYISGRCDDSLCSIQKRKVMELLGLTKEILGSIITTPARASEFLLRHEISHILHHDSDDTRLSESSHLDPYRIGIEARATWEAWKQMKNKYMAKFRVQRMYADNDPGQEKKSGMGLGTKILAGTAAVGAGLVGAKMGVFGAKAQMGVNKQLMNVGRTFNSEALMKSGAKGWAQGKYTSQMSAADNVLRKSTEGVTGDALKVLEKQKTGAQKMIDKFGTEAGRAERLEKLQQDAMKKWGTAPAAPAPAATATTTAFSDTKQDLREAALIGTGLTTVGTGIYLAKKGKLGKTAKKTYDKAVARVKRYYKEAERGGNKAQQEATNAAGNAGKKPFYSKEDKKAAEEYAKKNGLSSWQEAAEKLGFKPESYK